MSDLHEGRAENGRLRPRYLKALREAIGLSIDEAAAVCHTSPRNWRKWEQDEGSKYASYVPEAQYELFCLKNSLKYPVRFKEPKDVSRETQVSESAPAASSA